VEARDDVDVGCGTEFGSGALAFVSDVERTTEWAVRFSEETEEGAAEGAGDGTSVASSERDAGGGATSSVAKDGHGGTGSCCRSEN